MVRSAKKKEPEHPHPSRPPPPDDANGCARATTSTLLLLGRELFVPDSIWEPAKLMLETNLVVFGKVPFRHVLKHDTILALLLCRLECVTIRDYTK